MSLDTQARFEWLNNIVMRIGCLVLASIFLLIGLLCSGAYGSLMFISQPGFFVLAFILAALTAVPYGMLLLWLDHNEPEPPSLLITAFMWGACVSTMLSLVLNTSFGVFMYGLVEDEMVAGQLTASIAAPLFEELTKGAALLLLYLLFRKEFDNVLDGVIYGAIVGLGFAWFENIHYYMSSGNIGEMLAIFWVRGVVSASGGSHAAYTALVGLSFGLVRVMRTGFLRWSLVPIFMGLAMFAHFAWNTFAGFILGIVTPDNGLGQLVIGLPIAVIVLQLPFTSLLGLTVFFSWRHEHRIIRKYLSQEEPSIITEAELQELVPALRRMLRGTARFFTAGPSAWWLRRKLNRRQIDLAFLMWHHEQDKIGWSPDEDKDILRTREEIMTLRGQMS
jgi:RsiW-degrading membrane proteinase PrsW (M82 family)